ncbi:MAG: hypothetical protein QXN68_05700 [Thermoplasmata archaeon]
MKKGLKYALVSCLVLFVGLVLNKPLKTSGLELYVDYDTVIAWVEDEYIAFVQYDYDGTYVLHTTLDLVYNSVDAMPFDNGYLKEGMFVNNLYFSNGNYYIQIMEDIPDLVDLVWRTREDLVDMQVLTLIDFDIEYNYFVSGGEYYKIAIGLNPELYTYTIDNLSNISVVIPKEIGNSYQYLANYGSILYPYKSPVLSYHLGYRDAIEDLQEDIKNAYALGLLNGTAEMMSHGASEYNVGYRTAIEDLQIELLAEYDKGVLEGKSLGYIDGYNEGKHDGLNEQDAYGFGTFLGSLFIGVGSILGIELFQGITIGAIFLVPLVFGIIYFILGRKKE